MTARPAIWAAGLAGSMVLNAALAALLWLSIRPAPIADQPMPETRIDVQAHRLDRVEAKPQEARGDPARTAPATGAPLASGAIPTARANPAAARANRLTESAAGAPRLNPRTAQPDAARPQPVLARPLAAMAPPAQPAAAFLPQPAALTTVPPRLRPALAQIQPLAAVLTTAAPAPRPAAALIPASAPATLSVAAPAPAAAVRPDPAVLAGKRAAGTATPRVAPTPNPSAVLTPAPEPVALSAPQSAPTGASPPDPTRVASARPDPVAAPSAKPAAQPAPPAAANAKRLKAALAFSGGGEGNIDPVSLAAFQSFMRPGDATARTDALRDGVAGLLAQVPCSRLQVGFDPDTATLQVNGHIPEDDLRAPVLAALRARMGADIAISDNILILPRPQCGALSGIATVGLPQSTDQITNPLLIGREAHARVFRFARGELLSLDMTAPDYAAYIYLDYFDAGGDVLHLEPNEFAPLRRAGAAEIQQIGARTMQDTGLKLVIGPPYGQEIAVAFAASEPLYDGLRPISEPAAPYLDWLRGRVAEARKQSPAFKGEWVYFFVTTSSN